MSMFLAPIHYMMYEKIHLQDNLATELVKRLGDANMQKLLDNTAPQTEKAELAEVVDQSNIHGWLQNQVNISEVRFAKAVNILLESGVTIDKIKKELFYMGSDIHVTFGEASEVFSYMNRIFLDGMPCDHINSITDKSEKYITFRRSKNLHEDFFRALGMDGNLYFELRDSYLLGILSESGYALSEIRNEDGTSDITIKEK